MTRRQGEADRMGENETEKQRRCQSRFVADGANWKWKRHEELEADRDCQGDLICLRTENTQGPVVIGADSRGGDAGGTWWSAQILCSPFVVMSKGEHWPHLWRFVPSGGSFSVFPDEHLFEFSKKKISIELSSSWEKLVAHEELVATSMWSLVLGERCTACWRIPF